MKRSCPLPRTSRALVPALALLLTGAITLGACGSGSGTDTASAGTSSPAASTDSGDVTASAAVTDDASSSQSPAASQTPTTTGSLIQEETSPSGAPAWGTGADGQAAAAGSELVISDVRIGSHDDEDYSRFVVEFSGEGTPGWSAQWTDQAHTQGKGDPIDVRGDFTLVVTGTGVTMPISEEQQAVAYTEPVRFDFDAVGRDNDEGIEEAYIDLAFEDQFQVVLGTDSQTYRIFTLTNPTRLVIDVADDDTNDD
ncbi:AMIN-like domain-containing (lipo)protein [Actinomyces ruminicola]|uniref:AMIN domain-containing protein n=1 Tax=Actinomyces ruminicola TaxID=332524 RepID=A0A1G9WEB5_9ACTO|nr:AMIN domain-containing protein [Actinomyces ruminicola]SDM82839.1 AMIN domain-containing protein [Actinomyces ruminicola]